MTQPIPPVEWTQLPERHRRRLSTLPGQLAYRHWMEAQSTEGISNEDSDSGPTRGGREDPRPSPRPLGGGVRAAIDGAAGRAPSGIDTPASHGLKDRALQLGRSAQRVLVLDEDLGKSGASAEGRLGFQRLVAEVSLAQVGIVLGLEMSRLARSCRDWHPLLEVCAPFGTLIGDLDGVYDPANYNDRLLLGLKGTMSEAELHLLKQRLLAGKRAKAARGELGQRVPMGYIRRPSGEVVKEPDEQAQATIQLIFTQFERLGTINGVLRYLVQHQLQLPCRVAGGLHKGELEWHRPSRPTLSNLLHHPMYAGAYVY